VRPGDFYVAPPLCSGPRRPSLPSGPIPETAALLGRAWQLWGCRARRCASLGLERPSECSLTWTPASSSGITLPNLLSLDRSNGVLTAKAFPGWSHGAHAYRSWHPVSLTSRYLPLVVEGRRRRHLWLAPLVEAQKSRVGVSEG